MFSRLHKNAYKYGSDITSHDVLKCAAIFFMTLDHIGFFFFPQDLWWRVLGRICVPIWFFLLGYSRPSSPRKELLWLSLSMIVVDIILVSPIFPINILATIYVARYVVNYMAIKDKDIFMLLIFTVSALMLVPMSERFVEYGTLVFFFSLAGYYQRFFPEKFLAQASMFIGWAAFSAYQAYLFKMDNTQTIAMAMFLAITCLLLMRFTTKKLPMSGDNFTGVTLRYLGRNTHYYYAFHYIALQTIDAVIHPSALPWQIKWFYPLV